LSDSSRVLWDGFVADLVVLHGALADADRIVPEEVLRSRDRLEQLRAKISEDAPTVTGSRGQTRPHPLLDTVRYSAT
jgi:hypothetical protein